MRLASLLFFVLLVYAHFASGLDRPIDEPLCGFRDGDFGVLGYALFCSMALVGAIYTFTLRRWGEQVDAANTVGGGLLLLVVAATPSSWPLHRASAYVLLASIYAHYAIVLYRRGRRPMMQIHLAVPVLLAVGIGFQSYGLWQKGLICYFVLVAVAHHHIVTRRKDRGAEAAPHAPLKNEGASPLRIIVPRKDRCWTRAPIAGNERGLQEPRRQASS